MTRLVIAAVLLSACGSGDDPKVSHQTIVVPDGTFTVEYDTLTIQGDATDRFWTFEGQGSSSDGVSGSLLITIGVEVGMTLRAREYNCGANTYTIDITVNDRGATYVAGNQSGICSVIVNNVSMEGEIMTVDITANVARQGFNAANFTAYLEAPRSLP